MPRLSDCLVLRKEVGAKRRWSVGLCKDSTRWRWDVETKPVLGGL